MKKLFVLFFILWTTSCTLVDVQEEVKFKNPLFYQRLYPVSQSARETFLTPTSIKYSNDIDYKIKSQPDNGWTEGQCELLENEEYYIVLKCTYHNQKYMYEGATFISRFSINPKHCITDRYDNCWKLYVKEEDIEEDGHVSGMTTYTIHMEEAKQILPLP